MDAEGEERVDAEGEERMERSEVRGEPERSNENRKRALFVFHSIFSWLFLLNFASSLVRVCVYGGSGVADHR